MKWKMMAINTATFAVGVGVGISAVWYFFKSKYKNDISKKIDEIMESIKIPTPEDSINNVYNHIMAESNASSELPAKVNNGSISKLVNSSDDKVNYSKIIESYTTAKEETNDRPYVIPPSEFGENGYNTVSLTYYSDGLLADDMDELIENIDETVGVDSLNHFGEYEDDSVFVRNDRLKIDYEILLDNRKLIDVRRNSPCPLEDEEECED